MKIMNFLIYCNRSRGTYVYVYRYIICLSGMYLYCHSYSLVVLEADTNFVARVL